MLALVSLVFDAIINHRVDVSICLGNFEDETGPGICSSSVTIPTNYHGIK